VKQPTCKVIYAFYLLTYLLTYLFTLHFSGPLACLYDYTMYSSFTYLCYQTKLSVTLSQLHGNDGLRLLKILAGLMGSNGSLPPRMPSIFF